MSRIIITTVLALVLTLSIVALPAQVGLSDASANNNPEPSTWGKIKQLFASTACGWMQVMIDLGTIQGLAAIR